MPFQSVSNIDNDQIQPQFIRFLFHSVAPMTLDAIAFEFGQLPSNEFIHLLISPFFLKLFFFQKLVNLEMTSSEIRYRIWAAV